MATAGCGGSSKVCAGRDAGRGVVSGSIGTWIVYRSADGFDDGESVERSIWQGNRECVEAGGDGLRGATGERVRCAFFDAHRDKVYAGLFRRQGATLGLVEQEMVAAPADFITWVGQRVQKERVSWISMDPETMTGQAAWQERVKIGESVRRVPQCLLPRLEGSGRLRALEGRLTDVLKLDAECVRRPDAEVFWKDPTSRAR